MRIIGIDPGTRIAGYGIVDTHARAGPTPVAAGAWKLDTSLPQQKQHLAERLANLAIELRRVLEAYKPTHLCLELSFVASNPRTALFLGHARGVVLSEAHQYRLTITEMSATSAKKMIAGNGRAGKEDVARSMGRLLGFDVAKLPFDATDALALAYADALRQRFESHGGADRIRTDV